MSTLFATDLRQERLLQPSLDRCYTKHGISVQRCFDEEHQRSGVDLYLSKDGYTYGVDEKAQLHYIGQSLSTFALEIDLLKHGTPTSGWLFDATKATEVYAFVFDIRLHGGLTKLIRPTQVCALEVFLVGKRRLQEKLGDAGLDRSTLTRLSVDLRRSGERRRPVQHPGTAIVISRHLEEQPSNLLVERNFLQDIGQPMEWRMDLLSARELQSWNTSALRGRNSLL